MRHAIPALRSFRNSVKTWLVVGAATVPLLLLAPVVRAADGITPAAAPTVAPATQATSAIPVPMVAATPSPAEAAAPATGGAAPVAPAPAAGRAAPLRQPGKILVLRFETFGGRASDSWIAKSIQQSVLTDLITATRDEVVTDDNLAADPTIAVDAGRKIGAAYVVFGQVHVNEAAVRTTGQILSTENDRPVATLKATGSVNDLFGMEDALGDQARRAVARLELGNAPAPALEAPRPTVEATGPVQSSPALANSQLPGSYGNYTQYGAPPPDYGSYYSTPLLGYGPEYYPYYSYYPGIYVFGGFGHSGHHGHHGFGDGIRPGISGHVGVGHVGGAHIGLGSHFAGSHVGGGHVGGGRR